MNIRSAHLLLVSVLSVCLPGLVHAGPAVAAGYRHTAVLRPDGIILTFGENDNGQLGDGTIQDRYVPIEVPGLSGITAIAAGGFHTMAIRADGTVVVWGRKYPGRRLRTWLRPGHACG